MPARKLLPKAKRVNVPSSSGHPDVLTPPSTPLPEGSNSNLQVQLPDHPSREEGFEPEHVEDVTLENAQGSVEQPILEYNGSEVEYEGPSAEEKGKGREVLDSAGESSRVIDERFIDAAAQPLVGHSTVEGVPSSSRQPTVELSETPVEQEAGPSAKDKGKGRAVPDSDEQSRRPTLRAPLSELSDSEAQVQSRFRSSWGPETRLLLGLAARQSALEGVASSSRHPIVHHACPGEAFRSPLPMPTHLSEALRVRDASAANASSLQPDRSIWDCPSQVGESSTSNVGPSLTGGQYVTMSDAERRSGLANMSQFFRDSREAYIASQQGESERIANMFREANEFNEAEERGYRLAFGQNGPVFAPPMTPSPAFAVPESPEQARSFEGFNASAPAFDPSLSRMGSFRHPNVGSSREASAVSRVPAGAPTGPRNPMPERPLRAGQTEAFHNSVISPSDFNARLREGATAGKNVQPSQNNSPAPLPNRPGDRVPIRIRRAQSPHRDPTRYQDEDSEFMYPGNNLPMNLQPADAPARGWQMFLTRGEGRPRWVPSDCTVQYWPRLEGESQVDGRGNRIRIGLPHGYVPVLRAPGDNDGFNSFREERRALCRARQPTPTPDEQAYSSQAATTQATTLAAPESPAPSQTSEAGPSSSQAESSADTQARPDWSRYPVRASNARESKNWRRKGDGDRK